MLSSTYCWARQCGDGFKNRWANFPGRAWTTTTRGVANLARSGHNRGSTKLPHQALRSREGDHTAGFWWALLVERRPRSAIPIVHITADTLKDGDVENISRGNVRRGIRSDGRRSCPTGNLPRRIPQISSPSCGGLAGFRPTTVHSRQGNSTTTTTFCWIHRTTYLPLRCYA